MSGPCAASFGLEAAVLVSAQSIIQGAGEIDTGMAEADRQAAIVLEQSLRDLGYAIEETLFVEGGVAHFQRPEWGDYFVRLRVDPQRIPATVRHPEGTRHPDHRHAPAAGRRSARTGGRCREPAAAQ